MYGGYMRRLLFVDLSTGKMEEQVPDERLYHDFLGGYGLGCRILYDRQPAGADPFGPQNTLGLISGPLTGSPAIGGTRYTAVAKSPLTFGWGDANSGGHFGPALKFAGYDGVFCTGIAENPVYLLLDNGRAELKSAAGLWGLDTYATEDRLKSEYGQGAEVACIGPAGEKLARIACIINRRGDAAARSGLGAVMGSKRLKAVVARGDQPLPLADPAAVDRLRQAQLEMLKPRLAGFGRYGTSGHGDISAMSGDTPVKNWGGVGVIEVPDVSGLNKDVMIANLDHRKGCWRCPATCKGSLKAGVGYPYPPGTHRPEYETIGAFGANCKNTSAECIAMANHLCNSAGLDTISAGTLVAFAMELYEHGIISRADTGGIDLKWGDPDAIIALTEKLTRREAIGDVLAEGVKIAAEKIGGGAEAYAVHAGGQELGMHDPKLAGRPDQYPRHPTATVYKMDATPGRHTGSFGPDGFERHVNNCLGTCLFFMGPTPQTPGSGIGLSASMFQAVTGWDYPLEALLKAGERIANIRHVFTLREGTNPLERFVHGRIIGRPPLTEGPLAGVSLDVELETAWNLGALDWDRNTARPSKKKLLDLGLTDIAAELYPPR